MRILKTEKYPCRGKKQKTEKYPCRAKNRKIPMTEKYPCRGVKKSDGGIHSMGCLNWIHEWRENVECKI